MGALPLMLPLIQMQTQWASTLNPVIANDLINGLQLTGKALINGTTTMNHTLGRKMVGWFVTDIDGVASIYKPRTAAFNEKTLTLVSNAAVTVNIWVY